MLKFAKGLFFVLGVAAAVVAAIFIVKLFWQLNQLVGMAQANRSATVTAPRVQIWISIGAAALTGLFLGIALALPRRSARSIRNELARNQVVAERVDETPDERDRDRVVSEPVDETPDERDTDRMVSEPVDRTPDERDRDRAVSEPVDQPADLHDTREG